MVIVHGAGSRKENHGDFGRACAASGWAALAFDQRGHGASEDGLSPAAMTDVARMARFLADLDGVDEARVCVRGSSMGAFMAIQAAATSSAIAGAVAICPAGSDHLRRGLRSGRLDVRLDPGARAPLEAWLSEHDLRDAVELMGAKPLLLIHARGDDQIASEWSEELFSHAAEPRSWSCSRAATTAPHSTTPSSMASLFAGSSASSPEPTSEPATGSARAGSPSGRRPSR